MRDLTSANTFSVFWKLGFQVSEAEWEQAALAAADSWPEVHDTLCHGGVEALLEHIYAEGQFGPSRYKLSFSKHAYYSWVKPFLPRTFVNLAHKFYHHQQEVGFPLNWPAEERFARYMQRVVECLLRHRGQDSAPMISFWPNGARFSLVLTHDVELASGYNHVLALADLEERLGFHSSFNFVPERYQIDPAFLSELRARGFEIGVHGLKHDGRLFESRSEFERRAKKINDYLLKWEAVGFRSPFTHRQPEWMQSLNIEYDLSFFDTDPYETMPGGTMSLWPFYLGKFIELPYTLVQDSTLFFGRGQSSPHMWLEKVDVIRKYGGMALLNAHPDYLQEPRFQAVYEGFLQTMRAEGGFWHALPRDVARWWRLRAHSVSKHDLLAANIGQIQLSGGMIQVV